MAGTQSAEMTSLAAQHIQPLREFFITLAINEATESNRTPPSPAALVGEVFVKEMIARICLKASAGDVMEEMASSERKLGSTKTAPDSQGWSESRGSAFCHLESRDSESSDSCKVSSTPSSLIQTLLGSPEYEVRLVVLEHLSSRLRVSPCNAGSDQELEGHTCDEQSKWLLSVDQRATISMELYEMALTTEKHPECLCKVLLAVMWLFFLGIVTFFSLTIKKQF